MTTIERTVRRRTCTAYRITLSGAYPDAGGRPLVVELRGGPHGDHIRIREAGRRTWVDLDVAELYRRGLYSKARK